MKCWANERKVPNPKCGNPIMSSSQKSFRTDAQRKELGVRLWPSELPSNFRDPRNCASHGWLSAKAAFPLWASCLNSTLITGFPVYSLPVCPNIVAGTQKGKKKKIHVSTALHSWPSWEPLPGNVLLPPKPYFPNVNMAEGSRMLPS